VSDFINRTTKRQPGGGDRDFSDLMKMVEALSREVSSAERPQLSSRFLSSFTALTSGGGATVTRVVHGLGRRYRGWHLAGLDADASVWEADNAAIVANNIDTAVHLPLLCSADCSVKLVVW
jgi:hypothetical protein